MYAKVTAYTPFDPGCGPLTSTGKTSFVPGIAVDPKKIRYGSKITVPGYGSYIADDTGAAMRRDSANGILHIDIRLQDRKEALKWGVKWMTITIE